MTMTPTSSDHSKSCGAAAHLPTAAVSMGSPTVFVLHRSWRVSSRRQRRCASSTRVCYSLNVAARSFACVAQRGRITPPCGITTAARCARQVHLVAVLSSTTQHLSPNPPSRTLIPPYPHLVQASYKLHEAHRDMRAHLRADIGPLPRYATQREYDQHLERALVVHITALSKAWRQRDLRRFGVMESVTRHIVSRANESAGQMTDGQRDCLERVAAQMAARWPARVTTGRG